MSSYRATRRQFLRALGASAAAFPLANMLSHSVARAAAGAGPQRFIGVFHPHCATSSLWR